MVGLRAEELFFILVRERCPTLPTFENQRVDIEEYFLGFAECEEVLVVGVLNL
jgi:hypothetical protein